MSDIEWTPVGQDNAAEEQIEWTPMEATQEQDDIEWVAMGTPMPEQEEPLDLSDQVEDIKAAGGVAEVAGQMATGFIGAGVGTIEGVAEAIDKGDINAFVTKFKEVQEGMTYEPRTEKGKEYAESVAEVFEKYSSLVDEYLVEPNLENQNIMTAIMGKIAGEAVPLLAPVARVGKGKPPVNPRVQAEKAMSKDLTVREKPLEGEVVPKREGLRPEEIEVLERREGVTVEGEVGAQQRLGVEQKALPAPEKASVVDIEQAALKRTTKDIEVREIDPEIIEMEDPYAPGGSLEPAKVIDFSKFDPKQRGMIDPSVFAEGVQKMAKIVDESETMRKVRETTQPLQAGSPKAAGIIKNYANSREVIREQQRQLNKELASFSRGERENMLRSIEKPELLKDLSPRQQELVKEMRNDMENVLGPLAVQMGILGKVRKNYAKHVVLSYLKDSKQAKRMFGESYFKTWIKTGKRKYETLEAGEAAGIEYLTDFSVMSAARAELANTVYTKQFVNWVKEQDLGGGAQAMGRAGEEIPGYVTINHPAFQEKVFKNIRYITKDGKRHFVNKDTNSVEIGGKDYVIHNGKAYVDGKLLKVNKQVDVLSRNIQVHPDLASPLKSLLEADNPNILMKGFLKTKAGAMKVIMYNPAFHGMTVFFKAYPALPVNKMFNPLHDYVNGYRLNQITANRTDAIMHNVRFLGGKGYKQDIYGEIEVLRDNILHKVDPRLGDALDKAGEFWHGTLLWDRIGDLQMGMYDRMTKQNLIRDIKKFEKKNDRKPDAAEALKLEEDAKYAAGEFANLIAGAFGKEDFGAGWRNFLNSVLFSRSYTMSNLRLAKYGVGSMPKHLIGQMQAAKGVSKTDAARAFTGLAVATLFKDTFLLFGTMQGMNYAFTKMNDIPDKNGNVGGHYSWDNEPGKTWKIAIGTKENGQVVYMGSPFRAARDILEIGAKPRELLANKRNPVLTTAMQWVENRNFKGKTILKDGDAWYEHIAGTATHLAKGMTGYDTLYSTFSPDDESWRNRYRLLGLQISHGSPGGMVAGNLRSIMREQQDEKDLILTEASELMKGKDQAGAVQLMVDNNFTKGEIEGFIIRSKHPYAKLLKDLNWKSLYYKATPEQKKKLDNIRY